MRLIPVLVCVVVGIWIGSAFPEIGEMVLLNVKAGIEFMAQSISNMKG